jgi:hypothetical protein
MEPAAFKLVADGSTGGKRRAISRRVCCASVGLPDLQQRALVQQRGNHIVLGQTGSRPELGHGLAGPPDRRQGHAAGKARNGIRAVGTRGPFVFAGRVGEAVLPQKLVAPAQIRPGLRRIARRTGRPGGDAPPGSRRDAGATRAIAERP